MGDPALPVALFVHSRAGVLERTLACLRAAGVERLHVFCDGPRTADEEEGVERVRALVRSIDWATPTVVEHDRNLGLSESIVAGVSSLLRREERVLVVEDDVAIAPELPRFAAAALDHYREDDRVAGVTGLRFPFERASLRRYPYDAFVFPRFFSWGWATWRRAWETFAFDLDELGSRLQASGARVEDAGADLAEMLDALLVRRTLTGAWDVCCAGSMLANGQQFVVPTWNMVENTGLAAGTHYTKPPSWELRWEPEHRPDLARLRLPPVEADPAVSDGFRRFLAGPPAASLPRRLARRVSRRRAG